MNCERDHAMATLRGAERGFNMRRLTSVIGRTALVLLSVTVLRFAVADEQDPPGRVARLSFAEGSVSLQPAGVQDWADAVLNRPLTTGDKLWTDQDSRAELDIGDAAVRLGSTTGFSFLNLDDHTAQMQITAGTAIVRVRSMDNGEAYEVDTPNLAVTLTQAGEYRIEVNDTGDHTIVAVSEGEAQATGNGQGFPIRAQQKATFIGTDQVSSMVATLGAPDEFDDWALSRERQNQSAQSRQYVSPEVTGSADLDNNGRWENSPEYGPVWTPTVVAVGWAPYSFGHWVWVSPWGWTWVDNAPWGFAPFHYGRWVFLHQSWAWVPGPRYVHPVYAPALVAWVGGPQVSVSVSVGGGGVGWFPLGPREVFVPGYHVSPRYVQNVNVTNTTIVNRTYITNVYENRVTNITYVNRNAPGAVTAVSRSVFTSAAPVANNRMHIPETDLRRWTATSAAPAIVPVKDSVLGAGARANVRRPPPALIDRPVTARLAPPRPPVSFERQNEAIRANGGHPLGHEELARLQPSAPATRVRMVEPSMAERARQLRDNDNRGQDNRGQDNRAGDNRGQDNRSGDNRGPDNRGPNNASMVTARQGMRTDRPADRPATQPDTTAENRSAVYARQGVRGDRPPVQANTSAPQPQASPGSSVPVQPQPALRSDRPPSAMQGGRPAREDRSSGANSPGANDGSRDARTMHPTPYTPVTPDRATAQGYSAAPQRSSPPQSDRPASPPPTSNRPVYTPREESPPPPANRPTPAPREEQRYSPPPAPPRPAPTPAAPPPAAQQHGEQHGNGQQQHAEQQHAEQHQSRSKPEADRGKNQQQQ
jgi:hypothetical protein